MISLEWKSVELSLDPQTLAIKGLEDLDLSQGRLVYVIETPSDTPIQYEHGVSNICYIGRQGERLAGSRIYAHANGWIKRFLILSQSSGKFRMHFAHPRRRGDAEAFKDVELHLLSVFKDRFGSIPLFNNQHGFRRREFEVDLNTTLFNKRRREARIHYSPAAAM